MCRWGWQRPTLRASRYGAAGTALRSGDGDCGYRPDRCLAWCRGDPGGGLGAWPTQGGRVTPMMSEDFVREWFSDLVEAQSSLRTPTAICGEQQVARLEDAADRLPAAFGIVRPRRAPVLLALDGEPQFALHADPVLPVRHPDRERRLVRSGGNGERGDRGEGPAGTSSGQPHVSVTSVHSPLAFMVSDTKAGASNGAASP